MDVKQLRDQIKAAALSIKVEPAALMAMIEVESSGSGFLNAAGRRYICDSGTGHGRIQMDVTGFVKTLFEPHIFWRQLTKRNYNCSGLLTRADVRDAHGDISDILYQTWGDRPYGSEANQWGRLKRAMRLNHDAALCSASWGLGQIMGLHYAALGYASPTIFSDDQETYGGQIQAMAKFVTANGLADELNSHNWAGFASQYNGSGYKVNNYDGKLAAAYKRIAAGGA